MASQVQIINIALTRLGADPIASLTDSSTEAKVANVLWETARRSSLRDHPWNFAVTEVELAQIYGATTHGYKYVYQLPADCLRLLEVYGGADYKQSGRRLATNAEQCVIKYVKDVIDTTEWDALFVDVMAQRLCAEMAYAITKSQTTADSNFQLYAQKLAKARFVDATEEPQDGFGDAGFIVNARF